MSRVTEVSAEEVDRLGEYLFAEAMEAAGMVPRWRQQPDQVQRLWRRRASAALRQVFPGAKVSALP